MIARVLSCPLFLEKKLFTKEEQKNLMCNARFFRRCRTIYQEATLPNLYGTARSVASNVFSGIAGARPIALSLTVMASVGLMIQQALNCYGIDSYENRDIVTSAALLAGWVTIHRMTPTSHEQKSSEHKRLPVNPNWNQKILDTIGFPSELIPESFRCPLSSCIMDNPKAVPCGKAVPVICDQMNIAIWLINHTTNPFNRDPLHLSDLKPQPDLKMQIEEFTTGVKEDVARLKAMRPALVSLSYKEFQQIRDRNYLRVTTSEPVTPDTNNYPFTVKNRP